MQQNNEIPRAEIAQIVARFRGQPRTQDAIVEFCNLNKIEYIPTLEEYEDLEYQVIHDEKMSSIYKGILAELQKLEYVPEFASKKERKALIDNNDGVRIAITKLFEDAGVSFQMVDKASKEMGQLIGRVVELAGTTAFNKAMEVMQHIVREKFGGEYTMTHARDYAIELFNKHAKSQENSTSEVSGTEVSTPSDSDKPQEENGEGNR